MKLVKNIQDNCAILTAKGEFDSFVCTPFIDQIDHLIKDGVECVVMNMRLVKFINSTGIGSMIKCRRKLREKNGDLVISMPSKFVKEALESLGLTEVLKIFDDDDKAVSHFESSNGIEMENGSNIMVHLLGENSIPVIGRIRMLDEDGIHFETEEHDIKIKGDSEVRLKFRLPLFRKSHYFDITAKVQEVVHSSAGIMISTKFDHIFEDDRESISQFVKDMQFLRKEANNS